MHGAYTMAGSTELETGITPLKTVLIVEDNELNMKLFNDLLEAHGYRVLQTRDGLSALDIARQVGAEGVAHDERVAKVSIVGVGMRSHSGVAAQMFTALSKEGINIQMISTSEIAVSCVIEDKYAELAVRALHDAFGLGHSRSEGAR